MKTYKTETPLLDKQQQKLKASIPKGYFEQLEADVLNKIGVESATTKKKSKVSYAAIAATVTLLIGLAVWLTPLKSTLFSSDEVAEVTIESSVDTALAQVTIDELLAIEENEDFSNVFGDELESLDYDLIDDVL